jgi:dTMP kinase
MFISFEGIDGCGKSTQVRLLAQRLQGVGKAVVLVRDPGQTPISEAIRALLLDKNNTAMTSTTELLLYAAARAQMVETVIRPALQAGTIVLCDRFVDSTLAYQGFGRGLPLEDIERCKHVATGGLLPDITLVLDITLAVSKARCPSKQADRMELAGDAFFERVIEGYHHLIRTEPQRVKRIHAADSPERVHEEIWRILEPMC